MPGIGRRHIRYPYVALLAVLTVSIAACGEDTATAPFASSEAAFEAQNACYADDLYYDADGNCYSKDVIGLAESERAAVLVRPAAATTTTASSTTTSTSLPDEGSTTTEPTTNTTTSPAPPQTTRTTRAPTTTTTRAPTTTTTTFTPTTTPCSNGTGESADLEIVNDTDDAIDIFWYDPDCTPVYYNTLQPGESYIQPTTVGHEWFAEDVFGNFLGEWYQDFSYEVWYVS